MVIPASEGGGESGLTRILRIRDMNDFDRWSEREMALYYVSDVAALIEAAEAVIGFCDLEPGYKGGALTEAAKKLLE